MKDEEDEDVILPTHFPHRPAFLYPPPEKGKPNSRIHRETDVLRTKSKSSTRKPPLSDRKSKSLSQEPRLSDDKWKLYIAPAKPIPWSYEPDLRPKESFVHFPPERKPYVEIRSYRWKRSDYIPGIGDIYPDDDVEVTVTLTNDLDASEKWAEERLEEGCQIFGLETKWWTWEEPGLYYSDTYPGIWSDLALLQLATESEVLLLQPLDLPVERMGPKLRELLKVKYIKKATFRMEPKSKALKMCEIKIHGCHDFGQLLRLQLGLEYVKDLPVDFRNQDLSSMARLLVGLNLKPREACEAHWEAECLEDEWIEIAAMEAWSCWVLYGITTRMDRRHLELWNASLPEIFHSDTFHSARAERRKLLRENGTLLQSIYAAEESRQTARRTPKWKIAKQSAVELMHDMGLDLQKDVESDFRNS